MAESDFDSAFQLLPAHSSSYYDWVSENSGSGQPPLPTNAVLCGETGGAKYYVARTTRGNVGIGGTCSRSKDDQHFESFSLRKTPVVMYTAFDVLVPKAISFKWSHEISSDDKFDEASSLAPGEVAFASGMAEFRSEYYWFSVQATDGNENVCGVVSQWAKPIFFGRKTDWVPNTYRVLCFDF